MHRFYKEDVARFNIQKLQNLSSPIAQITAVHSSPESVLKMQHIATEVAAKGANLQSLAANWAVQRSYVHSRRGTLHHQVCQQCVFFSVFFFFFCYQAHA